MTQRPRAGRPLAILERINCAVLWGEPHRSKRVARILRAQGMLVGHKGVHYIKAFSEYDYRTSFQRTRAMDWESLIRFGLLGNENLEQCAILLVRVALGLFFAISGGNKLLVASRTQAMYETLVAAKVPLPRVMTWFVSTVEFAGGCLLIVELLSTLVSLALLLDMSVAILTTNLSGVPEGLSPLNWLDDILYLPEVLYALFFVWLICSGTGKFSVDYLIGARR